MGAKVEVTNSVGRTHLDLDFGDEFEEAIKYCRINDDCKRVLVPYCEECGKRIYQEDLPNGQSFSLMCRNCFGHNCSSLEEGGWGDWIEEATRRAGFKTDQ